ncbi:MAG: hypothetical protein ACXVJT_09880 [Thermoanaerobaculia bacterium]
MRPLAVAAALLLALPALADREVVHHISTSAPGRAVKRVVIDIPSGEITIRNGASGRIAVDGVVRREYDGNGEREEMQRLVDDVGVAIQLRGEEATIHRTFGPNARGWRARNVTNEEVTIEAPAGVDVVLETKYGEVRMDGSFGDVDISLRAGEVGLRMPRSEVRELTASCLVGEVHTNLGDRVIDREGLFPGHTHFENSSGRSHVNVHVTAGEVRVTLTQ